MKCCLMYTMLAEVKRLRYCSQALYEANRSLKTEQINTTKMCRGLLSFDSETTQVNILKQQCNESIKRLTEVSP